MINKNNQKQLTSKPFKVHNISKPETSSPNDPSVSSSNGNASQKNLDERVAM